MKAKNITKQIFVSYVRKDQELANVLVKELQNRGFRVWYDNKISTGANTLQEITKALDESDSMIAILDEYAFSSSYIREELQHAFFNDSYKNRLLPVLISQSSKINFERLPWILTKMDYLKISGNRSNESIAKSIVKKFIVLLEKEENL
jgi:hypothetical protein